MSLIAAKKKLLTAQKTGLDVASVYNASIWTGSGAARTITTGIDSSPESLVWAKRSNASSDHVLFDTIRGAGNSFSTNNTDLPTSLSGALTSFTSSGYVLGSNALVNTAGGVYVSRQFKAHENFFDMVSYTGDGSALREIPHALSVQPGFFFIRNLSTAGQSYAYHRSAGKNGTIPNYGPITFDSAFFTGNAILWPEDPSDTSISIGLTGSVNGIGDQYMGYVFAHDPDPTGVIQCASFTTDGSGAGSYYHGWGEGCQFVMLKCITAAGDWEMYDHVRSPGWATDNRLRANLANASDVVTRLSASGTTLNFTGLSASQTYALMAIRAT